MFSSASFSRGLSTFSTSQIRRKNPLFSFSSSCPFPASLAFSLSKRENSILHPRSFYSTEEPQSNNNQADDQGKGEKKEKKYSFPLKFIRGTKILPHPEKVERGGEDAVMSGPLWLGVADGVGGWIEKGIDSGLYARGLMEHASKRCEQLYGGDERIDKHVVHEILEYAQQKTKLPGSSTACLVTLSTLHGRPYYCVGNVGDSFAALFRPQMTTGRYHLVARTSEQYHFFNCPFQLAMDEGDDVTVGQFSMWEARPFDILILGTDGVSDNLFVDTIQNILHSSLSSIGLEEGDGNKEEVWKKISTTISENVAKASRTPVESNTTKNKSKTLLDLGTPFAVAANLEGYEYSGQKLDDVSVVTACLFPQDFQK